MQPQGQLTTTTVPSRQAQPCHRTHDMEAAAVAAPPTYPTTLRSAGFLGTAGDWSLGWNAIRIPGRSGHSQSSLCCRIVFRRPSRGGDRKHRKQRKKLRAPRGCTTGHGGDCRADQLQSRALTAPTGPRGQCGTRSTLQIGAVRGSRSWGVEWWLARSTPCPVRLTSRGCCVKFLRSIWTFPPSGRSPQICAEREHYFIILPNWTLACY